METGFLDEYNKLLSNDSRKIEFCKAGIDGDKRVFKIINSNIKTYNTFYKYLKEMVEEPDADHHHYVKRLKDIRLYSEGDSNIKSRMSIALKIQDNFEAGSFIRDFMIFVFSLNTECKIEESAEFIVDLLPQNIFNKYDQYLSEAISDKTIANPIFGIYVFYSDKELLYKYVDYVTNLDFEKRSILRNLEEESEDLIKKRIHDMQPSAIINEILIGSLYFKLCKMDLSSLNGFDNIIHKIISEYKMLADSIGLTNAPKISEWEKLERLLISLNNEEKAEILKSFGSISNNIEKYEADAFKNSVKMANNYGNEGIYTAKYRIGQSKFRKNLISQFDVIKCRICDCSISKVEFLKASHILEWSKSNEEEKVDPNNGFLLCPAHDFLFDSHLITFGDDGSIIISNSIDVNYYNDFRINKNTRINVLEENKPYLHKHRKQFKESDI